MSLPGQQFWCVTFWVYLVWFSFWECVKLLCRSVPLRDTKEKKNKRKVFLVQPPATMGIWRKENKCYKSFNFFFFLSFWPRAAATASPLPRCQSEGTSEGAAQEEKGECPKFQCNCIHNGREKTNRREFSLGSSVIAIPCQKKEKPLHL